MAPSIANIPDHYLWLGLGVFTFIAIQQVSHGLLHIRTLTEIHRLPHPRPSPPPSPTHQEDTIKTSSLLTLATSPNLDIRTSATKILCQRFFASPSAKKLWQKDLQSNDPEIKHRAQLVYNLLSEHDVGLAMPRERWRVHQPSLATLELDVQDLRRRRREAVVIHDGDVDRPVGEEDLFMRDAGEEGGEIGALEDHDFVSEGTAEREPADALALFERLRSMR
ncbi:hypothetical protein HBH69_129840 [Parastagonospora nodorum]|nr:hypothetical protein HBH54_030500 [Parastagonospora nodorum]KAH4200812.1 hypothetical protein HBI95_167670 [Parastagonospora nodorum]KAH4911426.1 hypothetical protein HBI80_024590 [Parastagonospora nodorum]KAH5034164.1 hypothetical protein HBI75_096080 [Parastagonospora nodorum]KAH5153297.1 hypothetical protein HBH69_129840 [Parastagonospora nodorum]